MHILFALIIFGYMGSSAAYVTRIGVYEKPAQCEQQGRALIGPSGSFAYYRCVPVNG
jgi:hypothetical protein